MNCLKGVIGLSVGVGVEASSGLYVDALPDISLPFGRNITDKGNDEVLKMWEDVENRALKKFRTLFIRQLNHCFKISDIAVSECLICNNKEILSTALWYFMGAELLTESLGSHRINRHTTIDRSRNKEMREELESVFMRELEVAVAGIDVAHSDCIEGKAEQRDLIEFHTPII